MITLLGMYDPPALRAANDRYWQGIRSALGYGPKALTRDVDFIEAWQSPDLLLSQTCGMPFRILLHGHVTLVGTPDYGLPGCKPGYYRSVLVVRAADNRRVLTDYSGATFAYNEALSQSGWAGPMTYLNRAGICFGSLIETGGHSASALAVAEGQADMAGLDALTWALLEEHDSDLTDKLRVIAPTKPTPALPYITAKGRDPTPIAAAVRTAIGGLTETDRQILHIKGFVDIPAEDYLTVPTPPTP